MEWGKSLFLSSVVSLFASYCATLFGVRALLFTLSTSSSSLEGAMVECYWYFPLSFQYYLLFPTSFLSKFILKLVYMKSFLDQFLGGLDWCPFVIGLSLFPLYNLIFFFQLVVLFFVLQGLKLIIGLNCFCLFQKSFTVPSI